jgi:hydroxymethylpyrimidine/phosphomethylpyrimidine kinase
VSRPIALTIAGSDPSGGAGLQADLKTFHQFGVYGTAVATLVTVQNTMRVSRVSILDTDLVTQQIRAVIEDLRPAAAKTGALGNAEIIRAVASIDPGCPLVVDPVMISKHGARLVSEDAVQAMIAHLLPRACLVTANLPEAEELSGLKDLKSVDRMREAAEKLAALGPLAVLIKGGHLTGPAVDVFYSEGRFTEFTADRIDTRHTHGTGCTYSAAITAELAKGSPLIDAISRAKAFITEAIRTAPGLGHGTGPVNHFASLNSPRQ